MLIEDVKACSFDSWYAMFKNITEESVILPLQNDFVKSLLEDRIIIPKSSLPPVTYDRDSSDDVDSWTASDDDSGSTVEHPEFHEFEADLETAIRKLGGEAFPKLNWSSPKDASWMLYDNSMKCRNFTDVYLLLKASDFIAHDLTAPFALCDDVPVDRLTEKPIDFQPILVLRRWIDYRPDGEFRCFVREHRLIAISQRMHDAYYPAIVHSADRIKDEVCTFMRKRILQRFPIASYTVDVYLEPSLSQTESSRITVVDFNVFGPPTDSLLFSWLELEQLAGAESGDSCPLFKFQNDRSIRPNTFSQYKVPVDFVELASGSDPDKLMDFLQTCVENQAKDQKL